MLFKSARTLALVCGSALTLGACAGEIQEYEKVPYEGRTASKGPVAERVVTGTGKADCNCRQLKRDLNNAREKIDRLNAALKDSGKK